MLGPCCCSHPSLILQSFSLTAAEAQVSRHGVWAVLRDSAAHTPVHPCVSQWHRGDSSSLASARSPHGTAQLASGSATAQALPRISWKRRPAPNS